MKETRYRKSRRVAITLLGATAAVVMGLATGCSDDSETTTARCVDANGNVLPDGSCSSYSNNISGGGTVSTAGGRWVYGGSASGGRVTGYSTSAPDSGHISTPSGEVLRGGFGGEGGGEGHGGEGGDGGGHGGGGGE